MLIVRAVLLCCALALVASVALGQAASQPPTPSDPKAGVHDNKDGANPNAASNPNTDRTPPTLDISLVQNATGNKSQGEEDRKSSAEWWLVGLTAVLAAVTAWLVIETRRLVSDAKATSNRQAKETETALGIAQQAADASTKSVESIERNAERQLRAYISVRPESIVGVSPGVAPFAGLTIINHGETPAHEFDLSSALELLPYPLPPRHIFEAANFQDIRTTVHPKAEQIAGAKREAGLTNEEMESIRLGRPMRIYVYGVAEYRDVFSAEARETKFCFSMSDLAQNEEGKWITRWEAAPIHNDAT